MSVPSQLRPLVSVTIVTYHSGDFIERCLDSVLNQTYSPLEVVVVDNVSTDHTLAVLNQFGGRIRIIENPTNTGFAAGQNRAIAESLGEWILVLNPDVVLAPNFIEQLMDGTTVDERAGTLCGRLMACSRSFEPIPGRIIDTAGIYFTPALRHLDRGWHQPDEPAFHSPEYVFGASAAAALYRREMIADIALDGEFFDSDFFAYREDADVAWRAQLLGWRCLYLPEAVGYHVRRVGPINRRSVPAFINMHSVKNRFLMRIKNMTSGLYRRFWLSVTARDVLVVGGCLLWEIRSLPAFWHFLRCLPRAIEKRCLIMDRRRVSDESLVPWFNHEPTAHPVVSTTFSYASAPPCGSSFAWPAASFSKPAAGRFSSLKP